jgi:hypothetical protein
MKSASHYRLMILAVVLVGCRNDSAGTLAEAIGPVPVASLSADNGPGFSDWSAPVNLGSPVNTAFNEQGVSLSKNGLSLYFNCGGCPGNLGGTDIWVSQRPSVEDPWGTPQRLGSNVNTTSNEAAPRLSRDGHLLFFYSNRPGGFGGSDLYVSRRRDKQDDFGWEPAVNLGDGINTTADEVQPDPFEDDATGSSTLYFASGPAGSAGMDIYVSTLRPDGTYGSGVPVPELNSSSVDRQPAIRRDGLEIFLASDRLGTLGGLDLWVSSRASTSDLWSTPVNLGAVVNSTANDARPALSFKGTELYFQSPRPEGLGGFDLWVTTRSKLQGPD